MSCKATTRRISGYRMLMAPFASALLLGAAACSGQATSESADLSPQPNHDSDIQGQSDATPLAFTYEIYEIVDDDVSRQAVHQFVFHGWDEWFDIVIDGDEHATPGAWKSYNATNLTSGIFYPGAAAFDHGSEQPATPTPYPDDLEQPWHSSDVSLIESSVDIHTMESDIDSVDPDTGATTNEDFDGQAPNGWMNPRFNATEDSFDGMRAMDDPSHALELLGNVLKHDTTDEDSLIQALVAELDRSADSLRLVALEDVGCDNCSDMVGVWDNEAQIPLVGFDITSDSHGQGMIVRSIAAAGPSDQAILGEATDAAQR